MVVILMGVAGAGKTTIGRLLAHALGWPFYEGDDFHPRANVEKMARGEPLTDAAREPWLAALESLIGDLQRRGVDAVLACSALKERYRERLARAGEVRFIFLHADPVVAAQRLRERRGHYLKAALAPSQYAALEEPADAVRIDACLPPADIVQAILGALGSDPTRRGQAPE
jgi:gluconokinase